MPAVSLLLEPYDPPQNEEEIFANIQAQDDYAQAGVALATASAAVLQGVEIPEGGGEQATGTATGAYGPPPIAIASAAPSAGPVYAVELGGAGVAEGTASGEYPGGPAPEYAAQATAGASPGPVYAVEPGGVQGVEEGRQAGIAGDTLADAAAIGSVGLEEPPERVQAQAGAFPIPPSLVAPPTAANAGAEQAQATAGRGQAVGGATGGTFAAPPDVIPIDPYQKVTPEQIVDMERRGYIFDYDENGQSVFRKAKDSAELARAIIGTQTAIHGLDVGRNLFSGDIVGAQAPLAEALGDAADVLGLPRGIVAAAAQIAPQNGIELLAAGLVPGLSPAADAADVLRLVRGAGRAAARGAIGLSQAYETSARSGVQTAGIGPRPRGKKPATAAAPTQAATAGARQAPPAVAPRAGGARAGASPAVSSQPVRAQGSATAATPPPPGAGKPPTGALSGAEPPSQLERDLQASIDAAKKTKAIPGAGLHEQIKNLPGAKAVGSVTQADGSAVAATPEAIQEASRRYLSRNVTKGGQVLGPTVNIPRTASRADMVNQALDQILNAKTLGGRKLMQGVSRDQLLDALADMPGDLRFVPLQTGSSGRIAARWVVDEADAFANAVADATAPSRSLQQALEESQRQIGLAAGAAPPPKGPPRGQLSLPGKDWQPGRSLKDTVLSNLGDAWNLPRSLLAAFDFSYPLRQGLLMVRHGREFADSFQTGFRAFFDDDLARQTMAAIEAKPRGTLHISPIEGGRLLDREEQFLSRWIGKIPLARRSQNASIVFINKLRADVYDTVTRSWMRTGYTPTFRDLEGLGNYINRATGYGSLGQFENAAGVLAQGLFSPRLLTARVQAPGYLFHSSAKVRAEAAKDFVSVFGGISALTGLAAMSGAAEVELDPRSPDFGKMRIGDTRIDPWGGYQQLARYTAQLISGEGKTSSGYVFDAEFGDTVLRFIRSKFNPVVGLSYNFATGENMIGERVTPAEWDRILKDTLVPIFWQDMVEAVREEGLLGGALTAPAFFGVGAQTYPPSDTEQLRRSDPTLYEAINDYYDAYDDAFRLARQDAPAGDPIKGFASLTEFRKDAERVYADSGYPVSTWATRLAALEKSYGISGYVRAAKERAVELDPDLVDYLEKLAREKKAEGEDAYGPPKWMRELADQVRKR